MSISWLVLCFFRIIADCTAFQLGRSQHWHPTCLLFAAAKFLTGKERKGNGKEWEGRNGKAWMDSE
jgi:hypothetical protein